MVTIAPELELSTITNADTNVDLPCLRWLTSKGIIVSIGHTEATEAQAHAAFAAGASMVTHAFNAMTPMLHRHNGAGVIGAACTADFSGTEAESELLVESKSKSVYVGLIADGVHVSPSVAVALTRMMTDTNSTHNTHTHAHTLTTTATPTPTHSSNAAIHTSAHASEGRVALVSDAVSPYGLSDGRYHDSRWINVHQGTCTLDDGTLAGSTVGLLECAQRLSSWSLDPDGAVTAATVVPRRVMGDDRDVCGILEGCHLSGLLRWTYGSQ